jgi:hypothetical protein
LPESLRESERIFTEFKLGDRVAAFHQTLDSHGSFAEYAIAWAYTTFHLPKKTSFEEVSVTLMVLFSNLLNCLGCHHPPRRNDCSNGPLSATKTSRALACDY